MSQSPGSACSLLPRSNPRISNFTLIGERNAAESDQGILLRAGTAGEFYNGIVVDFGEDCLDIDAAVVS